MTASDFPRKPGTPHPARLTPMLLCVLPVGMAALVFLHGERAGVSPLWAVPLVAAVLALVLWPNRVVVRGGELRLRAGA